MDKKVIKFDDSFEMRSSDSRLYSGFMDFMRYTKKNLAPKRILEIGTFKGESMELFKRELGEDIIFITIDPHTAVQTSTEVDHTVEIHFEGAFEESVNSKMMGMTNVGKIKFHSNDIHEMFADEYFDMIYIDGDHSYDAVRDDITNYAQKVRKGGWVAGHDYNHEYQDGTTSEALTKAIDEAYTKPDITFEDSTWIHFKK